MTADSSLSQAVRERYAEAARQALTTNTTSCCGGASGCGQSTAPLSIDPITSNLYDEEQTPFDGALAASLGCGNPTALIELQPGEHVGVASTYCSRHAGSPLVASPTAST